MSTIDSVMDRCLRGAVAAMATIRADRDAMNAVNPDACSLLQKVRQSAAACGRSAARPLAKPASGQCWD